MRKYLAIFILSIILIPVLFSLFISEVPNDVQPSLEGTQIIYKDVWAQQLMKSEIDNLSGIGMSIKNPYFRNRKDLTFNLLSEDKQMLRTLTINGANIPDGDLLKIEFEPVVDSKDKKYLFELKAEDTKDNEALEVFLTSKKASWIEDLYINSEKQDSKLSFITYHKSPNIFVSTTEIFTQLFRRLFADLPFAIPYVLLTSGLTGYLIYFRNEA